MGKKTDVALQADAALIFKGGSALLITPGSKGREVRYVSPQAVAAVFSSRRVDSDWLPPHTLRYGIGPAGPWYVFAVPASQHELAVSQGDEIVDLRVPLPQLVFVLSGATLYVVASLGLTPSTRVHRAPLSNVHDNGAVCLGSNALVNATPSSVLELFWSSPFTDHLMQNRCVSHPADVRVLLARLVGARSFPRRELVPMDMTLERYVNSVTGGIW